MDVRLVLPEQHLIWSCLFDSAEAELPPACCTTLCLFACMRNSVLLFGRKNFFHFPCRAGSKTVPVRSRQCRAVLEQPVPTQLRPNNANRTREIVTMLRSSIVWPNEKCDANNKAPMRACQKCWVCATVVIFPEGVVNKFSSHTQCKTHGCSHLATLLPYNLHEIVCVFTHTYTQFHSLYSEPRLSVAEFLCCRMHGQWWRAKTLISRTDKLYVTVWLLISPLAQSEFNRSYFVR